MVEEARLESVYTPKGYHEFESRSLRMFIIFLITKTAVLICQESRFFVLYRDTGKINLSLADIFFMDSPFPFRQGFRCRNAFPEALAFQFFRWDSVAQNQR